MEYVLSTLFLPLLFVFLISTRFRRWEKFEPVSCFEHTHIDQRSITEMSAKEERKDPRCLLAHPTQPHTLTPRTNSPSDFQSGCYNCCKQESKWGQGIGYHYYCTKCDVEFHFLCDQTPRNITHPFHLQHPLTLTSPNYQPNHEKSRSSDIIIQSQSNALFSKCTWCERDFKGARFYRCSVCNFCLDLSCVRNAPPLTIENPKSHHHSLVFFPRPLSVPCDACGLINKEPSYACFQCNYMVHQSCITLPRVIKITRHPHRLSHSPYLPSTTNPSCRICYKTVDIKYGQYSCKDKDCFYVVHSICATQREVWDQKELEWEPLESNETKDIAPFEMIDGGLIKHFAHEHLLKLEKYDGVRDAEKKCHACIRPIDSRDFYSCEQCHYFLHEVCACLPRKLDHALHKHPLVLDPSPQDKYSSLKCSICSRHSTGFWYTCLEKDCKTLTRFQIDLCCILVPECFTHTSHEHPLLFITSILNFQKIPCKNCNRKYMGSHLQCLQCNFALCYKCATIPTEIQYEHDAHPLFLCYEEPVADKYYWCEICEEKITMTRWFYTCNKCSVTVHCNCVFGSSVYMKHGYTFSYSKSAKVEVVCNNSNTRPICRDCGHRCSDSVYYKRGRRVVCSLDCSVSVKYKFKSQGT